MGFTSLREDILDRLAEVEQGGLAWSKLRAAAQGISQVEPASPTDLLRHIEELRRQIESDGLAQLPGTSSRSSFGLLHAMSGMLKMPVATRAEAIEVERELSRLCLEYRRAGELRRDSIIALRTQVRSVLRACGRLEDKIKSRRERSSEELERARAWAIEQLSQCEQLEELLSSVEKLWGEFEEKRLKALLGYRPRLAEVGRLQLAAEQEACVARDYEGHSRVNAAAGTGKSVVLVHKAIRLFAADGDKRVMVVTPTDSLAEEIRHAVVKLTGMEIGDARLQVKSLPEILREWNRLTGESSQILDSDAAVKSWGEFIDAADKDPEHALNMGAAPDLLRTLNNRLLNQQRVSVGVPSWVDARRSLWLRYSRALNYLRDELDWIVSGFMPREYGRYLERKDGAPLARDEREIRFDADERRVVLRVLLAWQDWLHNRHEMDLGLAAGKLLERLVQDEDAQKRFADIFLVDHLLIDEAQEIGNCEWGLLLQMVRDLKGRNAIIAAGDPEQRARVRRFVGAELIRRDGQIGLGFKGRAMTLSQQYRVTQQIADAGRRLVLRFGGVHPEIDEIDKRLTGFGACRDGLRPVVVEAQDQEQSVVDLLQAVRDDQTVALISARVLEDDLRVCERIAKRAGRTAMRLMRVGSNARDSTVAVGTIDAMAGREFDVVFIINFTALPTTSVPEEEWWREAAAAYSAMTRARELVVLCCPGRSPFLDALRAAPECVQSVRTAVEFRDYVKAVA